MNKNQKRLQICERGHRYHKTSDCPVCPVCWSGYYRQKHLADFPEKLPAPALRALLNACIFNLKELASHSAEEILKYHGMGPKSIPTLEKAMLEKGLSFRKSNS